MNLIILTLLYTPWYKASEVAAYKYACTERYYLVGSMSNQSCLHAISERSQEVSVYDSFCAADVGDAVVISLRQGIFS